jgi:hypothetical protein
LNFIIFVFLGGENFHILIQLLGKTGRLKTKMWAWLIHHSLLKLDLSICPALVTNTLNDLIALRCKALRQLNISGTSISSSKLLDLLSALPELKDLDVSSCPNIDSKLIPRFEQVSCNFEALSISNCRKLTNQAILDLLTSSPCKTLVHLNVSNTLISDAAVGALFGLLVSLQSMNVSFCSEINNPFDFVDVSHQIAISCLDLSVTHVNNQTVRHLFNACPKLTQLNISGPTDPTMLTDECLDMCSQIPHFRVLALAHCLSIHFPTLAALFCTNKMSALVSLDLSGLTQIDCVLIIKQCPVLHKLILEECRNLICVSESQHCCLLANKCLHHLSLKSSFFSALVGDNQGQQLCTLLSIIPNVRKLLLDFVEEVNDDVIKETVLARKILQDMEVLSLVGCGSITDGALEIIGNNLKFLDILDVSHCSALSRGDVDGFSARMSQQHRPIEVKWY